MTDLVCCGEILIDFVPTVQGYGLRHTETFEKAAGGAPANVAVGFSRLGGRSSFVGKVGADEFGRFLQETLAAAGVNTDYLYLTEEALTGLAFVSLRDDGERDFMFYRRPAADMLLRPDEVPRELIERARILHFGSVSLIAEPARGATLAAAGFAAERGRLVSFDPNLRPALWPDLALARRQIRQGLAFASVLKASEEELIFITGEAGTAGAARLFREYPRLVLIAVTSGQSGCMLCLRGRNYTLPAFPVKTVDTTGAGDGFTAGLLFMLNGQMIERHRDVMDWEIGDDFWMLAGRFANAVGALVVTGRGGIPAMPDRAAVERFLRKSRWPRLENV